MLSFLMGAYMARKSSVNDVFLLEAALEGLELQRKRIDEQITHVRSLLGKRPGAKSTSPIAVSTGQKRKLSPAARRRIAAAQKKRWAEYRKNAASNSSRKSRVRPDHKAASAVKKASEAA